MVVFFILSRIQRIGVINYYPTKMNGYSAKTVTQL
jgi:hypothetical protein